jgi:endonuclease-3
MAAQKKPKPALRLSPQDIEEMFRRFDKDKPAPTTELEYKNPYTLLVAVVLSAQSTDAGVNRATRSLFQHADTPQKMLKLGEARLQKAIGSIGLYRIKAKNVIALSKKLIDEFGGKVPDTHEALESLPGVGRKTANVILNTIYKHPTMAVDTHVFRVANRTGLAKGATPREVEDELLRVIPEKYLLNAHHWLILHGRYVCTARKPDCPHCLIRDICLYPDKTVEGA